jgi:hypothetical protein
MGLGHKKAGWSCDYCSVLNFKEWVGVFLFEGIFLNKK